MSERYIHNVFVATAAIWMLGAMVLINLVDWNAVDSTLQTLIILAWATHGAALAAVFRADRSS